jgi:Domain of unknown function (DUF4398)
MKFLTTLRTFNSRYEQIGTTANHVALAALIACGLGLTGCGNTLYLVQVGRAERNFEEAKQLGAENYAPYEYYSAKVRLEEAKRQAAEAEYGNAADLSDEATDFSNKAIVISKRAKAHVTDSETAK